MLKNVALRKLDSGVVFLEGYKHIAKFALFTGERLRFLHARRVDSAEIFESRLTTTVRIYMRESDSKPFLRFGCLFVVDSEKLLNATPRELRLFAHTTALSFLKSHFNEAGRFLIAEAFLSWFSSEDKKYYLR